LKLLGNQAIISLLVEVCPVSIIILDTASHSVILPAFKSSSTFCTTGACLASIVILPTSLDETALVAISIQGVALATSDGSARVFFTALETTSSNASVQGLNANFLSSIFIPTGARTSARTPTTKSGVPHSLVRLPSVPILYLSSSVAPINDLGQAYLANILVPSFNPASLNADNQG